MMTGACTTSRLSPGLRCLIAPLCMAEKVQLQRPGTAPQAAYASLGQRQQQGSGMQRQGLLEQARHEASD
jgi:hypothetical protein